MGVRFMLSNFFTILIWYGRAASRAPEGASEFCFRKYFLWKFRRASLASKGPPCQEHGMSFSIRSTSIWRKLLDNVGLKMWLEQTDFIFSASWLFKPLLLSKDEFEYFSSRGRVKKWVKFEFEVFEATERSKSLTFVKRCLWVDFHHAGSLQTKENLAFQISNVRSFSAFKISYFCQKRCLTSFSPSGKLTKWAKFVFARKSFRKVSLGK